MTSLLCFIAFSSAKESVPIPSEVAEGQHIFGRKKGIDRTQKDARVVIGQWFDGDRLLPVETAIFLTPGLLSRWIGYQAAEGTSVKDGMATWKKCIDLVSKPTHIIIQLSRLSTVDMVDGDVDNSANPNGLDTIKIQIREVGKPWNDINYKIVQDIQQRRPEEVLKDSWDQIAAKVSNWPSKATENELIPEIKWGRNRRVTLFAEAPTYPPNSKCEMRIVEKDRNRVVPFNFPKS